MFEIFPWSPHLDTGIAVIDEQHHVLVHLLNRLAEQHVQGASEEEIHAILTELADYADYHFTTEEGIWQTAFTGDEWLHKHVDAHQQFFAHITELRSGNRPFQQVLDDLFAYLTKWLAYHILDQDKRLSLAILGVREGLDLEAARERANEQMRGATAVLIETVLSMYQTVSAQAIDLMHEKLARQRAEAALRSSEERWHFFLGDADAQSPKRSQLEQRLRAVIDHVPAGLVVAEVQTRRFLFANDWFCQMLGYSMDEIVGMDPMDIHPPQALALVEEDFQRMFVGKKNAPLAIPVLCKDGSTFVANIERVPVELDGKTSVLAIFTDVTERLQAEQALQTSESHLRTLVDTIPDLIWLKDADGIYLSCNPAFERFFGAKEATIIGKTDHDFVPKELADFFRENDRAVMAARQARVNEEWITYADSGQRALLETTKVPMLDQQGALLGVLGISHDITEQRAAAAALEAERLRLQNAIDAVQAGTWEWNIVDGMISISGRTAAMLGREVPSTQQGSYDNYITLIHPDDLVRERELMAKHLSGELPRFEIEMRMRHKAGHWVWCRTLGRVTQRNADGSPLQVAGISIDISDQKTHREQIEYVTHHDALTGLPNRKMFVDLLARTMVATAPQRHLAVAYIDLDGFAAVNVAHGEEAASQLIVEVSRRLGSTLRERQHLAHIGGDEFAVILTDLAAAQDYMEPVKHLLSVVAQPLRLHGQELTVTASAGVTLYPQSEPVDAEQLLRQADQAMYLAKLAGKNRFHQFDPVKDESTRERLMLIDEIGQALVQNEFVLFYQPKVHLVSGEVIGFEALIRWQHPQRGLLPPGLFIPLLDRHPMAIELGNWVIETALAQLAQWQKLGLQTAVSVNIDAQQLLDPDFADRLQRQLEQQPNVQASQLELEILETGALENLPYVSALIARLQGIGLACALDDFGTGYSSLTFLKQLTARTLKIDQSFVRGMLDDVEDATIVNSVLGLARNFDRLALAEGVETEAHGRALIEFGCEFGQGYAIARPMPAANVPDWLAQWQTPRLWAKGGFAQPRDVSALLGEVEHRAWLKDLLAYVAGRLQLPPGNDPSTCRFGQWLRRPATIKRFGHHASFASVDQAHQALHLHTAGLLAQLQVDRQASVDPEISALEAISQKMIDELSNLRNEEAEPDDEVDWANSVFLER